MSDPMETIRDILGWPVKRPLLTTAVPSDDAAALGDGDWTPEDEA